MGYFENSGTGGCRHINAQVKVIHVSSDRMTGGMVYVRKHNYSILDTMALHLYVIKGTYLYFYLVGYRCLMMSLRDYRPEHPALPLRFPEHPHGRIRRCIQADHGAPQKRLDEAWREARAEM